MRTLAVIPARGGSKGIPRKNMRLMSEKPLIAYAIDNALASRLIDAVVVTSDSKEVLSFAGRYDGVIALDRASELAADATTLDPVVCDAVERVEEMMGGARFDVVVTLQPTSPLLTIDTLDAALEAFAGSNADTLISVVDSPHLGWHIEGDAVVPSYEKRLNRQDLPASYQETGGFLISRREHITPESRIGNRVKVFDVPADEAIDIDDWRDWMMCEMALNRKRIAFRVDGHEALGLGHVYRALTLAYEMIEHDVVFLCSSSSPMGSAHLRGANMPVIEFPDDASLLRWLELNRPDVYVHDCLDTTRDFMEAVRPFVGRLVTFEDLGDGAQVADAVVNALYEGASLHSNVFAGKRYVALRDEFRMSLPGQFREKARRALIMFGGTDPQDLSARAYEMARSFNADAGVNCIEFDLVLGPGYGGSVSVADSCPGINVIRGAARVSDLMHDADVALSSQGRTTFELASMGVPTIVLAQNDREQLHSFAQMGNGFINLGLGKDVSDEDLLATFKWLTNAPSVRGEMRRLMLGNDLKSGIKRVKGIILGEI